MPDRYYLLGENVGSSPTPQMMGTAFQRLGLPVLFLSLNVPPGEFVSVFQKLKDSGAAGFNITMPFKTKVPELLDSLDENASKTGAVNTVKREGKRFRGFNTDVTGIIRPLRARGVGKVDSAAVFGTGGAARAFAAAMSDFGCRRLTAISRLRESGERFVAHVKASYPDMDVVSSTIDSVSPGDFEILFNASPCGSREVPVPPQMARLLENRPTVFDAVYAPPESGVISLAEERGCRVVYGHEMLLHQGGEGFRIWTGAPPPLEAMRETLMASLEVLA